MVPQEFLAPIPAPRDFDWDAIPAPIEYRELLVDPTRLSERITFDPVYLHDGHPGALDKCLLRETVAQKLVQAVDKLPEDYSILLFDGLRPMSVQRSLYERFKAAAEKEHPELSPTQLEEYIDQFVAVPVMRPDRPSPHATGGAVDLTLSRGGVPLDMGTGFDDFTTLAYTAALEDHCPPRLEAARDNRRLLFHLMASVGLVNYECEWWHFAYGERQWAAREGCRAPIYGFCPECDN